MSALTDTQRRCVIDATIEPLRQFRRGYARGKFGPFYKPQTIETLIQNGHLRPTRHCGKSGRTVTALALEHSEAR